MVLGGLSGVGGEVSLSFVGLHERNGFLHPGATATIRETRGIFAGVH